MPTAPTAPPTLALRHLLALLRVLATVRRASAQVRPCKCCARLRRAELS